MTKRVAGVQSGEISSLSAPMTPPVTPSEAFGKHFLRCFFCCIGDRYTNDYFCEKGRELLIAVLDEYAEKAFA